MSGQLYTVIDAPPLPFLPTGFPALVFTLPGMPSVNDVLYLAPRGRAAAINDERQRGRSAGAAFLHARRIPVSLIRPGNYLRAREVVITDKLFCFVRVIRPESIKDAERSNKRRDIYNLLIKGFIDGLTDAGLWTDDSEEYHTDVWIHYAGLAPKGSVTLSFYTAGGTDEN